MGRFNLAETLRAIVRGFNGEPFLLCEVFAELDRQGIEYDPETIRKQIPHGFKLYGWTRKVGKLPTNEGIYQAADATPVSIGKAIALIEARGPDFSALPKKQRKRRPLAAHVRDIVQAYQGDRFAMDDVLFDLEDLKIDFNHKTARSCINRLLARKQIRVVEKIQGENIYQQTATEAFPILSGPDPAPEPKRIKKPTREGTFSAVCFAVMAGLERFSLQSLSHKIAKGGQWTHGEALQKAPSVIQRVRRAGMITATGTRPAVYHMAPRWYIDNLSNMEIYQNAAPHLFEQIVAVFFKHCGPGDKPIETPPENKPEDPPILSIASKVVEEMKHKIEDKTVALINTMNRVRDLESQNRKLTARIERLTEVIDEKNRTIAILQKRLNETLHGRQRQNNGFSLADLVHITGDPKNSGLEIIDGTEGPVKERAIK